MLFRSSNVYLIEAGDNILPAYSTKLSIKATKYLEKLGVTIKTNEKVENIEEMILPEEDAIKYDTGQNIKVSFNVNNSYLFSSETGVSALS